MPPAEDNRDYQRLANIARRRRVDLGIALNDANAKRGGLSNRTWQRVENGLKIWDTNYRKVDQLLRWASGSCIAVLEGGDPVPVDDVEGAPGVQKSPLPQEVVDREAANVVQLALIATARGSTAEEIRRQSERVVHDLREHGLI